MRISKRSWHYRLYRFIRNIPEGPRYLNPFSRVHRTDYPTPRSLCPYFWTIFLGLVGAATVGIVLAVAAVVAAPFYLLWRIGVFAAAAVDVSRISLPHHKRKTKVAKEKHPSLVVAAVKASKDKVCPMIELVD